MARRTLATRKPVTPPDPRLPQFLNVDMDVESARNLDPLVEAFGRRVIVLHREHRRGRHFATLELSRQPRGPNAAIQSFVKLVEHLPPRARALWNGSRRRVFDIGVDVGKGGHIPVIALSEDTVARASTVGARVLVTCYPPLPASPRRPIRHFRLE